MFTVAGAFDDGATYTVQITGRADHPVIGSHRAAALVKLHLGEKVPVGYGPQKSRLVTVEMLSSTRASSYSLASSRRGYSSGCKSPSYVRCHPLPEASVMVSSLAYQGPAASGTNTGAAPTARSNFEGISMRLQAGRSPSQKVRSSKPYPHWRFRFSASNQA